MTEPTVYYITGYMSEPTVDYITGYMTEHTLDYITGYMTEPTVDYITGYMSEPTVDYITGYMSEPTVDYITGYMTEPTVDYITGYMTEPTLDYITGYMTEPTLDYITGYMTEPTVDYITGCGKLSFIHTVPMEIITDITNTTTYLLRGGQLTFLPTFKYSNNVLTLVNFAHISSAGLTWFALSMYFAHLELTYLSAVSRDCASSRHSMAFCILPAC